MRGFKRCVGESSQQQKQQQSIECGVFPKAGWLRTMRASSSNCRIIATYRCWITFRVLDGC
jgi:hypothetical protein